MRISLFFILLICLVSRGIFAQAYQEINIETNQIVSVDEDEAWAIVQDWPNLNKLVPKVVERTLLSGTGIDSSWDIYLTNGGIIKEKMVYYNVNQKTLSYCMTETPMPIKDYLAIIKVEPYGIKKSLISFYTSCKVDAENEENIINAFRSFQETFLSNIENQNNEK